MPDVLQASDNGVSQNVGHDEIQIGSRVIVRYLDGARAGYEANFHLVDQNAGSATYTSSDDFVVLPAGAPIAQALLGAVTGEVVSYPINDETIQVEVLDTENNPA